MTTQNSLSGEIKVLDEIIDNAVGLPIESQYLLLMMAKAMQYTRDCVMQQYAAEQSRKLQNRQRAN